MIEVVKTLANADRMAAWLESVVRPHLTEDISRYARGRLRAWLRDEPSLTTPTRLSPGLPVDDRVLERLRELLEWDFDFCLVTYSGDDTPIGIGPHRDAGFADYEAMAIQVSGEAKFDYWCDREGFGYAQTTGKAPASGPPSHTLLLTPGQVLRFNSKNQHAASPGVKRWNLNFWKQKPPKKS